jgi:nucleotide-binding universal stress UspA family protein
MYQKILVPLDGSARAEAILPHVEELAHCHHSQVIFVSVIDPAASLTGLEGLEMDVNRQLIQEQVDEAEAYLAGKEGEFREKNIESRSMIRYGAVVNTIISIAEDEKVGLIAIASHGRTGLARFVYGSVAAGILQQVDSPLLLIRARG